MRFHFLMIACAAAALRLSAFEPNIDSFRSESNLGIAVFHLQSDSNPPIISNTNNCFENCVPTFALETDAMSPQKIWWQICDEEDFSEIPVLIESIDKWADEVKLDRQADSLIHNGRTYFFRAKCLYPDGWTCWSEAFPFSATKPDVVFGDDFPVMETLAGIAKKSKTKPKVSTHYTKSPYVSDDVWARVKPHLLPTNLPLKAKLDKLFAKFRVTHDANTLAKAGFETPNERPYSHTHVSKNSKLSGYYFKMFTDIQGGLLDWQLLLTRIHGAESLQRTIDKLGYQKIFCVPKKWLYPIPPNPPPAPNTHRKNFILVAEDMKLLKKYESYARWKSDRVTPQLLDAVYIVLQTEGLIDSAWAFNMPFTKDGRIAFIDTEKHHQWPVPFGCLLKYLNPEMQAYWQKLMNQGGPKK